MKSLSLFTMMMICYCVLLAQEHKPRINHTAIYVADLGQSARFYRNVIGLDSIAEPFHDGRHAWFRTGPGSSLHIIEGATEKKSYFKNHHTCYRVPSVEAFVEVLRKYGLPWEDAQGKKMATTSRVDGVKQIWLQDPDGYWLEINNDRSGLFP